MLAAEHPMPNNAMQIVITLRIASPKGSFGPT